MFASGKYVVKDNASTEGPTITSPVGGLEDIMERHPNPPRVERRNDDESTTQTSRTEDDPVGDAVRAALAAGAIADDDDERERGGENGSKTISGAGVATDDGYFLCRFERCDIRILRLDF